MKKLRLLDLFSGIGGMSLGLERSGYFETVAFCEIEPFPRRVLAKHWLGVPCYDDVRTLTADRLAADGIAVDAVCGGFPCQDISYAGHGQGLAGKRSGLFWEFDRIIGETRPRFIVLENVAALLRRGLSDVLAALAARGYDAWWRVVPAYFVGLPQTRERVWILAYSDQIGYEACIRLEAAFSGIPSHRPMGEVLFQLSRTRGGGVRWIPNGIICSVNNGVSANVDGLGAAGNAVVPQMPELIGRAIGEALAAVAPS